MLARGQAVPPGVEPRQASDRAVRSGERPLEHPLARSRARGRSSARRRYDGAAADAGVERRGRGRGGGRGDRRGCCAEAAWALIGRPAGRSAARRWRAALTQLAAAAARAAPDGPSVFAARWPAPDRDAAAARRSRAARTSLDADRRDDARCTGTSRGCRRRRPTIVARGRRRCCASDRAGDRRRCACASARRASWTARTSAATATGGDEQLAGLPAGQGASRAGPVDWCGRVTSLGERVSRSSRGRSGCARERTSGRARR
jgi:hypothetical protein